VKVSALGGDDGPHPPSQRRNVIKQRQRREVIAPAGVVAPPFACADLCGAIRYVDTPAKKPSSPAHWE